MMTCILYDHIYDIIMFNIMQKQHLRHVAIVLERLGYQLHSNQWQLMWSHDYPFTSHRALIKSLKPHQKVRSCDTADQIRSCDHYT